MLNTFPGLLTFSLLAPFIIRLTVGFVFLNFGYQKLKNHSASLPTFEAIGLRPAAAFVRIFGLLELVAGGFLIAGFLSQISALVAGAISIGVVIIKTKRPDLFVNSRGFFFLLFILSLSLTLTGAGFWSFDLPL
jgi:uncharacterized membrane protein YphA (DoxX/SURF4 family)